MIVDFIVVQYWLDEKLSISVAKVQSTSLKLKSIDPPKEGSVQVLIGSIGNRGRIGPTVEVGVSIRMLCANSLHEPVEMFPDGSVKAG